MDAPRPTRMIPWAGIPYSPWRAHILQTGYPFPSSWRIEPAMSEQRSHPVGGVDIRRQPKKSMHRFQTKLRVDVTSYRYDGRRVSAALEQL